MTRPIHVAAYCRSSRWTGTGLSSLTMLAMTILVTVSILAVVYVDVVEGHEGPHPPPTLSPAPTSSPAPSPSPSATPTDTQSPTETQEPSTQPTFFPTTTFPSNGPTDDPTSSPAPSPSPSEAPTMDPSAAPSGSPSKSFQPTTTPSSDPSSTPTISPTMTHSPTKTASPTGPEIIVARGIHFAVPIIDVSITENGGSSSNSSSIFHIFTDADANDEQVESTELKRVYTILEEVIKMHLQRHLDMADVPKEEGGGGTDDGNTNTPEGVVDGTFEVEAVTVSDSNLKQQQQQRRRQQQQQQHMHDDLSKDGEDDVHDHQLELLVTLEVVAIAILERESTFDLKLFLELLLGNDEHRMAIIESFQTLYEEDVTTRNEMNNGPVDDTSSNSRGSAVAGSLVGLTVLSVGFLVISALRKRQRERYPNDDKGLFNLRTITASRSDESSKDDDDDDDGPNKPSKQCNINGDTERSSSDDLESKISFAQDVWPSSKNEILGSSNLDDGGQSHQSFQTTEQFSRSQLLHNGDDFNDTDDDNDDGQGLVIPWAAPSHLMYTPALIETESNIEVPETPCTTFGSVFSWSRHSRRGDRSIMTKQDDGNSVANNNDTIDIQPNEQEVSFSPSSHIPPRTSQMKKNGRKSETNKSSKRMSKLFNGGGLFPSFHKKRADGDDKNDNPDKEDDEKSKDIPTRVEDDDASVATGGLVFVAEDESGLGFSTAPMDNQINNQHENQTVMHTVGDDILPIEIGGPESLPSLSRSRFPKSRASTGTMTHSSEHFNRSRQTMKSRASLGMPQRSFQQSSAGTLPQRNNGDHSQMLSSRRATSIHYFSDDSEEE